MTESPKRTAAKKAVDLKLTTEQAALINAVLASVQYENPDHQELAAQIRKEIREIG